MNVNKMLGCLSLGVILLLSTACGTSQASVSDTKTQAAESQSKMPAFSKAPIADEYAVFTTNMGSFKIRLYGSKAPITVKNFEYLVKKGFYNDLTFHRVID